jgi:hypothetical protein
LRVVIETGLGPANPLLDGAGNPRDPEMSLRWSNNGGRSYTDYITKGAGKSGDFRKRVVFRRLGRSRDRVFELSATDPIPWRVIDAYMDAEVGA